MPAIGEPLTIVIPTRERSEKLSQALESCLRTSSDRLRVLVCDNASTDATREVACGTGDSRVRYVRTEKRLSMMLNFEFALSQVNSGYVIAIGDDDAVVAENIPPFLEFLDEKLPLAVRSVPLEYYWDSHPDPALRCILKNLPVGRRAYEVDSVQVLRDSAATCDPRILCGGLPSIYHGCVHNSVIDEIRRRDGAFLRANCSDFYSAVIVGAYLKKHWMITWPVTLSALSNRSNGASLLHATQKQERREIELFWEEGALPLHERLCEMSDSQPFARVGPMITADNLLRAREVDPSIPAPDLNGLVDICVSLASKKNNREDFDLFIAAAESVAQRNDLAVAAKVAAAAFVPQPAQRAVTRYDAAKKMFTAIDLAPFGATDALSAARCVVEIEQTFAAQASERQEPGPPLPQTQLTPDESVTADLALLALSSHLRGRVVDQCASARRRELILQPPSFATAYLPLANPQSPIGSVLLRPAAGPSPIVVSDIARLVPSLEKGGKLYLPIIPGRGGALEWVSPWMKSLEAVGVHAEVLQLRGDSRIHFAIAAISYAASLRQPVLKNLFRASVAPWIRLALKSARRYHTVQTDTRGSGLLSVLEIGN